MTGRLGLGIALLGLSCSGPVRAPEPPPTAAEVSGWRYDPENARDILDTCAACHGRRGEGGKDGAYPRLAGLDELYLARQLRAFKARERINIPMYPYTSERELPPDDVRDIARLLSQIELPTKMPELTEDMTAYERLRAVHEVFDVPRVDGDIERGAELYEEECSDCHGEEGWGEDDVPQLAGQHTNYLRRQVRKYRSGERVSEDMEGVFDDLDDEDLEDIYAYLADRDG